jgi:hypothetical protein
VVLFRNDVKLLKTKKMQSPSIRGRNGAAGAQQASSKQVDQSKNDQKGRLSNCASRTIVPIGMTNYLNWTNDKEMFCKKTQQCSNASLCLLLLLALASYEMIDSAHS